MWTQCVSFTEALMHDGFELQEQCMQQDQCMQADVYLVVDVVMVDVGILFP